MPRYSIIEIRKDLYCIYSEGECLFKTNTKELAISKVRQLEYIDFLKESMNPFKKIIMLLIFHRRLYKPQMLYLQQQFSRRVHLQYYYNSQD